MPIAKDHRGREAGARALAIRDQFEGRNAAVRKVGAHRRGPKCDRVYGPPCPRCRPRSDQRTVEDWGSGSDNFLKDPPNATVSVFQKDGNGVRDAVVLNNPKLEGETLAFDIDVLEGDIKGADGAASVFIDIIGRPLTPMSFGGVARRTAYRGAYYAGAAAVGAAGVGAAAYGAYGPRCGYYPYPPCY
jgi:hypothetical protein